MPELIRAALFNTPRNPFYDPTALEVFPDAGLLVNDGVIAALGDYAQLRQANPDIAVRDLRGSYIFPGFVDTHVHYPQVRVLGGLGHSLLDWLDRHALPEEARMSQPVYAREVAGEFLYCLASHGTTT